eukprot:COSAG02_NODE_534_length_20663_cov_20.040945_6_plen_87_part_00
MAMVDVNADNMEDHCPAVDVLRVEDVVASAWFKAALSSDGTSADAIVVLAHMDAEDPLVCYSSVTSSLVVNIEVPYSYSIQTSKPL